MLVENAWVSLVAFIQTLRDKLEADGVLNDPKYIEWDAHASIMDLPASDLIGLSAFAVSDDANVAVINCAVGVATYNEENLFRLRKASAILFEALRPTKVIPYLDATTGDRLGEIKLISGTSAHPVARADVRSLQFTQFEGLLEMS
jgi:hypothetical protein